MAIEYKILSQKDKWFTGKFDPETLEAAMNAYASQGWRVETGATAKFPGVLGPREEMITVLSREDTGGNMYEYKILTQKDKWFTGKFDPQTLENAINAYAEQGWKVIFTATATIPGFGATREEMIIILERQK